MGKLQFDKSEYISRTCHLLEKYINEHMKSNRLASMGLVKAMRLSIDKGIFPSTPEGGVTEEMWNSGRPVRTLLTNSWKLGKIDQLFPNISFTVKGDMLYEIEFKNEESSSEVLTEIDYYTDQDRIQILSDLKRSVNKYWFNQNDDNWINVKDALSELNIFLTDLRALGQDDLANIYQECRKLPIEKKAMHEHIVEARRIYFRAFEPWPKQEISLLKAALEYTEDVYRLSNVFGRSPSSLEFKIEELR
jgi:hypothetical protein